jgi:hypothetical protein
MTNTAARNGSTKETTPSTIWMSEVETEAVRRAPEVSEIARDRDVRDRLLRAYHAGEPVWMAADELTFVARVRAKARKAEAEASSLRAIIAGVRQ